jgi:DNA mismatch endonuclease (patch repair protein)
MTDVLNRKQRSYCMSRIQGKDTGAELQLRKALWNLGIRYRLRSSLPGRPDVVIVGARVAVFVDGCFWHQCPKHFTMPKSRRRFWATKIQNNRVRDRLVNGMLRKAGWKVIRVWEHEVESHLDFVCKRIASTIAVSGRISRPRGKAQG